MSEWIVILDEKPPDGMLIDIKAEYDDECHIGKAVYNLHQIDEWTKAWSWTIKEGYECTYRPTHWRRIGHIPDDEKMIHT